MSVLVACTLVLHGIVPGLAQAAMPEETLDALHVICSASDSGQTALPGNDGNDLAGATSSCPCGTLCHLAPTAMPAILSAPGPGVLAQERESSVVAADLQTGDASRSRGLIAEPRAPPSFS